MLFERSAREAHGKFIGGRICLDFANTVNDFRNEKGTDDLAGYTDLVDWAKRAGILKPGEAQHLLDAARRNSSDADRAFTGALHFRGAIYRLFSAIAREKPPAAADLEILNSVLREAAPHAYLKREPGGFVWTWPDNVSGLDIMLRPIALSAAALLTSDELARLRECNGTRCTWLFLDRSKNQTRRWCAMSDCGNRAKGRAHYHRKLAGKSE